MGSPEAKGLFEKAISESGAGGSVLLPIRGGGVSAEKLGEQWAASIGLPHATADQLRALPVQKLLKRSFPFIDGKVIVDSPGAPFSRGSEAKVPLIIGANSNEATLPGNNDTQARKVLGDSYDAALKDYTSVLHDKARTALAEDALSILPSYSIAAMHASNGARAYNYYFDQVPANLRPGSAGTPHGGELEYLFGNPDAGSRWDAADRKVSDTIAGYWVRFARSGNPNGKGAPYWPLVPARGPHSYLTIGTPTRAERLSPARERVRLRSLATSQAGWEASRRP
jgi:para-nitrobenzyl esterase